MKHFLVVALIFLTVLLIFLFAPRGAAAEDGAAAFRDHCAVCHGIAADGDGPMAPVLSVAPPDLTALAAANGGAFPLGRVLRHVDGREEVIAHGGPMPIFGLLLDGPSAAILAPDGSEIVTSEALAIIVAWLEERQR